MKATVQQALEAISDGELVVVVDDPGREDEGDLVLAADAVTPEAVNFMATHARGLVCLALEGSRLDDLEIGPMTSADPEGAETNFTVSIDLDVPGSTGISAFDRARTVRNAVVNDEARPSEFRRPGHVFPLRYTEGGVLARRGHTEASVDLARLAGCRPAGLICEIMAEDGSMARGPELVAFARHHDLPMITVEDLVRYRRTHEGAGDGRQRAASATRSVERPGIRRDVETRIPTSYGDWRAIGYESVRDALQHVVLVYGDPLESPAPLVRVHSECLTGDVFHSMRCDCGSQLENAMARIAAEGAGAIVYVRGHEGRGIGLLSKLRAYALQDEGRDTIEANVEMGFPADARDYQVAADMLLDLGLDQIRLHTNNPDKVVGLRGYGVMVVDREDARGTPTPQNARYLATKRERFGHLMPLVSSADHGPYPHRSYTMLDVIGAEQPARPTPALSAVQQRREEHLRPIAAGE